MDTLLIVTFDPLSRYTIQRGSRLDRNARLRPMTSGEILDASLSVYQNIGGLLLKVSVVPSLLCMAALVFVFEHVLPSLTTTNATGIGGELIEALIAIAVAVGVGGPLFFLGVSYASAVTTEIVGDQIVGSVPNLEAAKRAARRNLLRVFALSFREAVFSVAGLVASALMLMASAFMNDRHIGVEYTAFLAGFSIFTLIVGLAVFPCVLILHAIAIPVCVHEGMPAGKAFKRGRMLLKGNPPMQTSGYDAVWGLVGLIFLLLLLIGGGITAAMQLTGFSPWVEQLSPNLAFRPLIVGAVDYLPLFLTIWTIIPVWATTTTILYFERRIRLEGYDIESLAKDIWRADRHSRFEL